MRLFLTFVCIFAFRQVLCTWRENVLALIHESKATTWADEHYRRAILSKVGCVQQVPRSQYRCWFRQGSGNTIRRTKNINIRATTKRDLQSGSLILFLQMSLKLISVTLWLFVFLLLIP